MAHSWSCSAGWVSLTLPVEAAPPLQLGVGCVVWDGDWAGLHLSFDPAGLAGTTTELEWDPDSKATPSRVRVWKTRGRSPGSRTRAGTHPSPPTPPGRRSCALRQRSLPHR